MPHTNDSRTKIPRFLEKAEAEERKWDKTSIKAVLRCYSNLQGQVELPDIVEWTINFKLQSPEKCKTTHINIFCRTGRRPCFKFKRKRSLESSWNDSRNSTTAYLGVHVNGNKSATILRLLYVKRAHLGTFLSDVKCSEKSTISKSAQKCTTHHHSQLSVPIYWNKCLSSSIKCVKQEREYSFMAA